MPSKKTVAIAGGGGFIGRSLARELQSEYNVTSICRNPPQNNQDGIEWRKADLFALLQCENALKGADYAVYLVHSMLPSARLTQGSFQNMDLIIADNFARAAATQGIKHIVYLGGLVPDDARLSPHLESRLEVERTLGARGVPVTALRAGMVIGPGGSSYEMLVSLVKRMPLIFCPSCADSLTQPIALADALKLIKYCLDNPSTSNQAYDIGSPDVLSYKELIRRTAMALGLKRQILTTPFKGLFMYKHALALASASPLALVAPLLESMRHSMVARDRRLQDRAQIPGMPFELALARALAESVSSGPKKKRNRGPLEHRSVRSVQRIPLPPGKTARWVAEIYSFWLPHFLGFFLTAETDKDLNLRLLLRFPRILLMELTYSKRRSIGKDRPLFIITGGILAKQKGVDPNNRPRLEFREALGGKYVLVAIHQYQPTLPWFIYNLTQALAHIWVMKRFAEYLAKFRDDEADGLI
jgi:uncharacterized protein YbjT (DUF2867 family)